MRRYMFMAPLISAILILSGLGAYMFVIPRSALEVRTVYHETPGGGGTGGIMNINVLLTNKGNRQIEGLTCDSSVIGPVNTMDSNSITGLSLSPRNDAELKMTFVGSQYDDYEIVIHIRFECRGQTVIGDIVHVTTEDDMNQVFVERL